MSAARVSTVRERAVICTVCRGDGYVPVRCSLVRCLPCRGRGFFHVAPGEVSSVVPNLGTRGGESKIKAVALAVLVMAALACASEGTSTADGGGPSRGPLVADAVSNVVPDVVTVADVVSDTAPDAVSVADVVSADLSVADARGSGDLAWPVCPSLPRGSYGTELCPLSGGTCYAASVDGGPLGACWRFVDDASAPLAYVPSCGVCP